MAASLPPSSSRTRLRSAAADTLTFLPVAIDPVKETPRGTGCSVIHWPSVVAAGDDVEHPGRDEVAQDLAHRHRHDRGERRRLEHHRAAGPEGGGDGVDGHPDRHVPRLDGGDDPDRAAHDLDQGGVVVLDRHAGNVEIGVVAEVPGRPEHAGDAGRQRHALLQGRQPAKPLGVRLQGVGAGVHDRAPLLVVVFPAAEGALGALHRRVELLAGAVGNLGEHLAGGRVDHRQRARAGYRLPVDRHRVLAHELPPGSP